MRILAGLLLLAAAILLILEGGAVFYVCAALNGASGLIFIFLGLAGDP